jgi:hypothetical protein
MKPTISLRRALADKHLLGGVLPGDSWSAWRTLLIEAISAGDRSKALAALREAEPVIMRSAQKNIVHRNAASRKISRLTHRIAKLGS